ncbi:Uu.00g078270.m01.CDS01 [Anthostomella pinea]|uniref:Uu.00g078270.m01.CDS01 n=1 Tax=Anthostomella pinea TaxID=933095 RepID=A0AAI8VLJ0_9PEZI|nr:Uu.00g078270.m01.CDS01 [Anthostomella pinea]
MADRDSDRPESTANDPMQSPELSNESNSDSSESRARNGNGNIKAEGEGTREADPPSKPAAPSKPGIMAKLGLDVPTLSLMFKGAIPPVVALAICQSHAVAEQFTTLGYLVGIISVLSMSIMPRGKFIQTMVLNVLFASVGAAVALLMLWSSLQARLHTQSSPAVPGSLSPPYNSSQAAVSAIWLFANIWFVNTLRAKYPSVNLPSIVYSIMTNITCTYSPIMTSTASFESLVKRLFTAMLTGFAIATICSLFILPISSRVVTQGQMKGAIMLLRGAVKQEKKYLQSLEREDMFAVPGDISCGTGTDGESAERANKKEKDSARPNSTAEADAIKETVFKLRQVVGKIYADLPFAKREIAWGKLEGRDLSAILNYLRAIVIPVVGMSTVIDIFQRVAEKRGWVTTADTPPSLIAEKNEQKRVWNEVMKRLHEPFEQLSGAIDEGLQHAAMMLEILPRPKAQKKRNGQSSSSSTDADVESKGSLVLPGDPGFADSLKSRVKCFRDVRSEILYTWAWEKGLATEGTPLEKVDSIPLTQKDEKHRHDQSQLYVLLYIETLMQAAGQAVIQFVLYADSKVEDGTMRKNRLMVPKSKLIKKWISSIFSEEDRSQEQSADLFDTGMTIVSMGDGFAKKKDPEHLHPTNTWQRIGNSLRGISGFLSSEESSFGFRVACATLTIGIVAFLENTHTFFTQQRLVWAMIIIAIGMTQTSGQSIFGFLCRTIGTLLAMVFSLITWYIVDEKTPGIFIFLYLFLVFDHYFLFKYPQFIPAVMICMVTQVMIIGYELQVLEIGEAAAESTGQPVYPIYELAPYRLACVAGGCLVAFIWTIFPWPVTERTWLRRDLSATLYLLATYFSVINETLRSKLEATGGNPDVKGTPAHRLAKHRRQLFGKLMLLLPALKQHADFQRWEPTIGGAFPRQTYQDIIRRATRINSYLTLLAYTVGGSGGPSMTLTGEDHSVFTNKKNSRAWIDALAELLTDISPTQHTIISTLTLLSNALQSGHSLPPHLSLPRPYELTRQLESIEAAAARDDSRFGSAGTDSDGDSDGTTKTRRRGVVLLDARNMTQAGYAEFAVLQVCSTLVCDDLEGLVENVSQLVGVVDFSYRVQRGGDASQSDSGTESDGGGKGKGKAD